MAFLAALGPIVAAGAGGAAAAGAGTMLTAGAIMAGASVAANVYSSYSSRMGINSANAANRRNLLQSQGWEEYMRGSAHQAEVDDLRAAGLNPILSGTGGPGGSWHSIAPQATIPEPGVNVDVSSAVSAGRQMELLEEQIKTQKATQAGLLAKADSDIAQAARTRELTPLEGGELTSRTKKQSFEGQRGEFDLEVLKEKWRQGFTAAEWEQAFERGFLGIQEAKQVVIQAIQRTMIGTSAVSRAAVEKRIWDAPKGELAVIMEKLGVHGAGVLAGSEVSANVQNWIGDKLDFLPSAPAPGSHSVPWR